MTATRLLREYIRELLTESVIDPKIMNMIDGVEAEKGYVKITYNSAKVMIDGRNVAFIEFEVPGSRQGECSGAKIVSFSEAERGYGPLAYDIAIEATGGLAPDRREVSNDARNVWAYYEKNRPDVITSQLDDEHNSLTPEDVDNCEQKSAMDDEGSYHFERSPLSKKYFKKSGTPVIDELRKRGMIKE